MSTAQSWPPSNLKSHLPVKENIFIIKQCMPKKFLFCLKFLSFLAQSGILTKLVLSKLPTLIEALREKTGFLHVRKQRCRSVVRLN